MQQPSGKRSQGLTHASGHGEALPVAWTRMLDPVAGPAAEHVVLGFFLEMVNDENEAAGRLEAAPVLLTVLAQGRYARPTPLDGKHLSAAALTLAEMRLAATVLGLGQTVRKGRTYARLSAHLGDALLAEMLDTAPCFFGGTAGLHLSRGKARPLGWRWQLEKDGRQRLLPVLPNSQRLLRIEHLWYLDAEHAEMGILEGGLEETAWLDLPSLSPEHSQAMRHALAEAGRESRVPAPQVFDGVRRASLPPQPVVVLHALTRHARLAVGTPPLAYARLAFDYAGERLPGRGGEPLVRRVRSGSLVEITRRRAEELASMEHLEAAGLNPAVDTDES